MNEIIITKVGKNTYTERMEDIMDNNGTNRIPNRRMSKEQQISNNIEQPSRYRSDSSPEKLEKFAKKITRGCYWLSTSNPKTIKGLREGYVTAVLSLAPAKTSGTNVCFRFKHCEPDCLYKKGRGQMKMVQQARITKTKLFFDNQEEAIMAIHCELRRIKRQLKDTDLLLACRLNCFSDLKWEEMTFECLDNKTIFDANPDIQFYDYTKYPLYYRQAWSEMPLNYHLTYSYDGTKEDLVNCLAVLKSGFNVKMILKKKAWNILKGTEWFTELPTKGKDYTYQIIGFLKTYLNNNYQTYFNESVMGEVLNYSLTNSELTDNRFNDPSPSICLGVEKGHTQIAL